MGIILAVQSALAIVQSGLSLWSIPGVVGGCAGLFVRLGTLLEWTAFDQERSDSSPASFAILGFAIVASVAGAIVAVL
jgi:hypothetical protein